MENMDDQMQQRKVVAYANKINELLMGTDLAEAESALSLAVVAMIVFHHKTLEERRRAAAGLSSQVRGWVEREDIIEWLQGAIIPTQIGHA
jgi:hypothetical protein